MVILVVVSEFLFVYWLFTNVISFYRGFFRYLALFLGVIFDIDFCMIVVEFFFVRF